MLSVHSLSSIGEDLQRAAQVQQTQIESKHRTTDLINSSTTASSQGFAVNCPRGLWSTNKNSSNNSSQASAAGDQQQQRQSHSATFLTRCPTGNRNSWSFNEEELNNRHGRPNNTKSRASVAAAHDEPHPVATILNDLSPVPKVTNQNRSVVGATSHMSPPMTFKGWHSKSPDAKAMR